MESYMVEINMFQNINFFFYFSFQSFYGGNL